MNDFDLSPESKLQKYNELNGSKNAGYIEYIPQKTQDIEEEDSVIDFSSYVTNGLFKRQPAPLQTRSKQPQTDKVEELWVDPEDAINYDSVEFKNAEETEIKRAENVNMNSWTLPNLGKSAKQIVASIDNSKYDVDMKRYLKQLASYESDFDPTVVNRYGYAGLYQFGNSTLAGVGIKKRDYMGSVELQHEAAVRLANSNYKALKKYEGRVVNGIKATKFGIMAAAHLGGSGNVENLFESNGKIDFKDGNKVPITRYLKNFQ